MMKEFEKIFNRRIERTIKLSISMNKPRGLSKKEIAELTWREALKWALSEFGGDCDYHIIEQELEDE